MIIFVFIIVMIMLYGIKPAKPNKYFDPCTHKQTSMINGIFTMLILVSHASMYLTYGGRWLHNSYAEFRGYLGQFVVAPFLFYSGFGMMESIAKKGQDYIRGIPKNRFFKVWYHFALALIPYLILCILRHNNISVSHFILSLIGYKSLGNSNWYMFDLFIMYIVIYLCFTVFNKSRVAGVISVFVVTYIISKIFQEAEMDLIFVISIFCMPTGMAFSLLRPYLKRLVTKNDFVYLLVFVGLGVAVHFLQIDKYESPYIYNLYQIAGIFAITMFCMKFKIENKIIEFFSKHIFSIFMLQRVPMIILDHFKVSENPYLFVSLSFVFTIIIAVIFDIFTAYTDKLIFSITNQTTKQKPLPDKLG
ncbi:acyltransferase family protein [uncultured Eubacterium sp.]|uniref:acyltransferase family protein n=1 Tax=uncultured Eubacterium sp. TaxID=165185 RepID=UPI0015B07B6E|nr:acyltransferase family protein [uncultured Eubacterium sp.]